MLYYCLASIFLHYLVLLEVSLIYPIWYIYYKVELFDSSEEVYGRHTPHRQSGNSTRGKVFYCCLTCYFCPLNSVSGWSWDGIPAESSQNLPCCNLAVIWRRCKSSLMGQIWIFFSYIVVRLSIKLSGCAL